MRLCGSHDKYNFRQVQCKLPDDGRRPKQVGRDIYVYFNANFNVFLNKKVHLLVSEFYVYQNAQ